MPGLLKLVLVEPTYLSLPWGQVLSLLLVLTLGKAAILGFTTVLFGHRNVVPIAVGLGISQIGEFSFVLARASWIS